MVFGSFLSKTGRIKLTSADNKQIILNKNMVEKVGIWLIGIPHLGLRGRAKAIMDNLKTKKRIIILDAGCGPGLYTTYLALKGYDITGTDISKKKIEEAKEINRRAGGSSTFINGDLCALPFKKESFDLIICSDVIEHITADYKAIAEFSWVLKEEGKLILTTTGNNRFTAKYKETFLHQRNGYDAKDFQRLINHTDLKLVKDSPCFSFFGKIAWLTNRKLSKFPILCAVLFYPLFWISFLDISLRIDTNPFNRIFIAVKEK